MFVVSSLHLFCLRTFFFLVSLPHPTPIYSIRKTEAIQILKGEHRFIFHCSKPLTPTPFRVYSSHLRLPCAPFFVFYKKISGDLLYAVKQSLRTVLMTQQRQTAHAIALPLIAGLLFIHCLYCNGQQGPSRSPPTMPEPSTSFST